jgi:ankyrin repeat protein
MPPAKFALTKLLMKHGADPNILSDDGQSPLSIAIHRGYAQSIGLPLI